MVEMAKRGLTAQGALGVSKYRHHGQDRHGQLIKRWGKTPHYRAIETFPHHLHDGAEDHVVSHSVRAGLEVLQRTLEEAGARE